MPSTGHAEVAYTPMHELPECPLLVDAGEIAGAQAFRVLERAVSPNLVEEAVGVATINALSQIAFERDANGGQ